MTADEFNASQLALHLLTPAHVTELVKAWQASHGLTVDGYAGPLTISSLAGTAQVAGGFQVEENWLVGPGVTRIPAHPSWYGARLTGGAPRGIVAHFTATNPGTAINMANRRTRQFGSDPDDRAASWHISIETDGAIVVMVPLDHVAWHAGSSTALPVPGLGPANLSTIGIELVGWGKDFPAAQVNAAGRVWRALVQHYGIAREYAMLQHSVIDPTRRDDPGPVWMGQHSEGVLGVAYQPMDAQPMLVG